MIWKVGMPNLGHTMEQGRVDQWLKRQGDAVARGEAIAVVESDKVNVDIESPADGVLLRILVQEDGEVGVGGTLALVGAAGEQAEADRMAETLDGAHAGEDGSSPRSDPAAAQFAGDVAMPGRRERVRASPRARRRADELGVDLASLGGSGPDGLITIEDVERAAGGVPAAARAEPLPVARRTLAERMSQSWREIPRVTLIREIPLEALETFRAQTPAAPPLNALLLQASARALRRHPCLNAWYTNAGIVRHEAVHLAMAVALEGTLIAPVLRDAGASTAGELGEELARLVAKARAGELAPQDVAGATFTVSNLGASGVDWFTPIINPPQVSILGVGRARYRVVVERGRMRPQKVLPLCLVIDHRVVDGADGAAFLETLEGMLAAPADLIGAAGVTDHA